MSKFSILINSCDAYSDAWEPFFNLLLINWPEVIKYKIYLNTETKSYKHLNLDITVLNTNGPENKSWGRRLNQALDRIEDDYVLFLLEDFYFEKPVLFEEINKCVKYLDRDSSIAAFSFSSPYECSNKKFCDKNSSKEYPNYVRRKQITYYKLNAGPTLWRKSKLKKWTFDSDTPWVWEYFGSKRTWFSKDKFYARDISAPEIFLYDIDHGGAIHRGKWVGYKMKELISKFNIQIDMTNRPIVDDWMKEDAVSNYIPKYKRLPSIIKNMYLTISNVVYGFFHR